MPLEVNFAQAEGFRLYISQFTISCNDSQRQFSCYNGRKRNCKKLSTKYILKALKDNYKTSQNYTLSNLSIFYWTAWLILTNGEILLTIVFLLQKSWLNELSKNSDSDGFDFIISKCIILQWIITKGRKQRDKFLVEIRLHTKKSYLQLLRVVFS